MNKITEKAIIAFLISLNFTAVYSQSLETITDVSSQKNVVNSAYTDKIVYVTQMHIHGWSNHNGSPKPGSLQYHAKQADSVGVDVLWWTEHNGIFKPSALSFPFKGGTVNPITLDLGNLPSSASYIPNQWKCLSKEGVSNAVIKSDTLTLSLQSAVGDTIDKTFSYSPRHNGDLIKKANFIQPLASRPILQFKVKPSFGSGNDTRIQVVVKLSWHLRNKEKQDIITYELVNNSNLPSTVTNSQDSVTVVLPLNSNWQTVQLNLTEAAQYLNHGIDNTFSEYQLKLISKNGKSITTSFLDFKFIPLQLSADSIIATEKSELDYLSANYHAHNLLGIEYSGAQHLNAFVSDTVNDRDIYSGKTKGNVLNWVQNTHQHGGLVSYNHPFGTGWTASSQANQDYREDTLVAHIISNQAYQSDIIEVGYYKRGGADLNHHLRVWDKLTAKGKFLYGNGISDSHGALWMNNDSLFHTFVYAADSSDYELLHALSLGHMFFGNQKFFKGGFNYSIGNLEMGDRGFINSASEQPVINLNPFPTNCVIKLTQVLLSNSPKLTYLHNLTVIDTAALPVLDLSQPCFIRFAVYDTFGHALAIGQPIVVLGVSPPKLNEKINTESVILNTFPNPTDENINMELSIIKDGNYDIQLLDLNGKTVKQVDNRYFYLGSYGYMVDVRELAPATYIITVTGNNTSISKKIIVN